MEDYKSEELESQDEELRKEIMVSVQFGTAQIEAFGNFLHPGGAHPGQNLSKSDFHLVLQVIFHIPYGNLSAVEYASCQG